MFVKIVQFLLVLISVIALAESYGFRYRYEPLTQQTNLWTYLPGMGAPTILDNNHIVQTQAAAADNPGLFQYQGANGQLRWKCKIDAYYSEFYRKCQWKPNHYFRG